MTKPFGFRLLETDGSARTGQIGTPRGIIRTPAFMPVGTAATVKAMFPETVRDAGADVVLCNTYHLMLRPGAERVARLGGLHRFMSWEGPILTDSGGYQVMSLAKLRKLSEEGVAFQSHIDGATHLLTPERAVEIQNLLGSDIQMQLDECTPFPASYEEASISMELSLRWARRSKEAHAKSGSPHALFGIVQGGVYQDLRQRSAEMLTGIAFDGYAIGGLAVGEGQAAMLEVLDATAPSLPRDRPRYLMGVGTPEDMLLAVARGIDMFDCVMPTRAGRHGLAFTWNGRVNLRNAAHADDDRALDPDSGCSAAQTSRAYLHHLVKCGEHLAAMLLTWNNVAFYQELMARAREAIAAGTYAAFTAETLARFARKESTEESDG